MILTHGVGGRQDLPLPLEYVIAGAVLALVVSFGLLALTTKRAAEGQVVAPQDPQSRNPRGWPLPRLGRVVDSPAWTALWRIVGLLIFAYFVLVAFAGSDNALNPIFGMTYVWLWVGLVPFSLLFGPVWKAISPARTFVAGLLWLRGPGGPPLRLPERLGYWPAAFTLLAFAWLELVYPENNYLGPVRLWLAVYLAVMILGGVLFGEDFLERSDPFEVYSSLTAKLSVWGRTQAGNLVLRTPLGNLDTLRPAPGLVAVVSVLFGTIVYDSYRESPPWLQIVQSPEISGGTAYLISNLALVSFPLIVAGFYCVGTMLTGVGDVPRRALPAELAPSIVPIIVGYVVAHYLSYFWESGLATLRNASDPLGNGGDWFGTADLPVSYFFAFHATLLAVIKVAAVIIGHVLGVWSAHIRALQVLPKQHLVTGQVPLLVTMVGFTVGGLYLLFAA
ncbi:hypothetical protein G5C66_22065 [Nocardioides sp. KC13]|uniref:Fenitrothion hydrolase n=1 Tax=Nocardioides turkmenicus TaxID=2711220 RepID=A0A6M1R9Z3_9ACTN|nr:hypothetical protein [Nocardioides sp. KC13]